MIWLTCLVCSILCFTPISENQAEWLTWEISEFTGKKRSDIYHCLPVLLSSKSVRISVSPDTGLESSVELLVIARQRRENLANYFVRNCSLCQTHLEMANCCCSLV